MAVITDNLLKIAPINGLHQFIEKSARLHQENMRVIFGRLSVHPYIVGPLIINPPAPVL